LCQIILREGCLSITGIVDLILAHENHDFHRMANQIEDGESVTTHVLNINNCQNAKLTANILTDIINLTKIFAKRSRKHRDSLKCAVHNFIYEVTKMISL